MSTRVAVTAAFAHLSSLLALRRASSTARVSPAGYGGGMSSAKAALESDTRVLAYEAGRKWGVRVNTISAGPLGSRAAKAIGFIDDMIRRAPAWAPWGRCWVSRTRPHCGLACWGPVLIWVRPAAGARSLAQERPALQPCQRGRGRAPARRALALAPGTRRAARRGRGAAGRDRGAGGADHIEGAGRAERTAR